MKLVPRVTILRVLRVHQQKGSRGGSQPFETLGSILQYTSIRLSFTSVQGQGGFLPMSSEQMDRRRFLHQTAAGVGALAAGLSGGCEEKPQSAAPPPPPA